jgi:hypothetical protein
MQQKKRKVNNNHFLIDFIRYFVEVQVIAKSTIVLDVKPWDDETDLDLMEKSVRSIEADGLLWGPCKSNKTINWNFLFIFIICS